MQTHRVITNFLLQSTVLLQKVCIPSLFLASCNPDCISCFHLFGRLFTCASALDRILFEKLISDCLTSEISYPVYIISIVFLSTVCIIFSNFYMSGIALFLNIFYKDCLLTR